MNEINETKGTDLSGELMNAFHRRYGESVANCQLPHPPIEDCRKWFIAGSMATRAEAVRRNEERLRMCERAIRRANIQLMATAVLIVAIVLGSLLAALGAPTGGLAQAWGGYHTERWLDTEGRLVGTHYRFVAALSATSSTDNTASYSPWDGPGNPSPDYVVARGTLWRWRGTTVLSGYNWTQYADGRTVKQALDVASIEIVPPGPKFVWGTYEDGDESGDYRLSSWFNHEVWNATASSYDITVQVWWESDAPHHSTTSRYSVKAGELNGCIPQPKGTPWAWAYDDKISERARL